MAFDLKTTRGYATSSGVKLMGYGRAGSGKTSAILSLPAPVILSAESGLLPLSDFDLPYENIDSKEKFDEAYEWLTNSQDAQQFKSVAVDSISDIAASVLAKEKENAKDPRQAYSAMQDIVWDIMRKLHTLPGKHVYVTAKADKHTDADGRVMWAPKLPGKVLTGDAPYIFDIVMALRVEGYGDQAQRAFMTGCDSQWEAKDRSGKLNHWEPGQLCLDNGKAVMDVGSIIRKIAG